MNVELGKEAVHNNFTNNMTSTNTPTIDRHVELHF